MWGTYELIQHLMISQLNGVLCPVMSIVLSCPVLSCPVLSSPVLFCSVLSCHVMSCRVVAYTRLAWPDPTWAGQLAPILELL